MRDACQNKTNRAVFDNPQNGSPKPTDSFYHAADSGRQFFQRHSNHRRGQPDNIFCCSKNGRRKLSTDCSNNPNKPFFKPFAQRIRGGKYRSSKPGHARNNRLQNRRDKLNRLNNRIGYPSQSDKKAVKGGHIFFHIFANAFHCFCGFFPNCIPKRIRFKLCFSQILYELFHRFQVLCIFLILLFIGIYRIQLIGVFFPGSPSQIIRRFYNIADCFRTALNIGKINLRQLLKIFGNCPKCFGFPVKPVQDLCQGSKPLYHAVLHLPGTDNALNPDSDFLQFACICIFEQIQRGSQIHDL